MRTYRSFLSLTAFHFRSLFRQKITLVFSLIMPAILVVLFGGIYSGKGTTPTYAIGVVDSDGGEAARAIRQAIVESGLFDVQLGTESELMDRLSAGKIGAVVILPAGMTGEMQARTGPATVTIHWDKTSQPSGAAMMMLQGQLGRLNALMVGAPPVLVATSEALPVASGSTVLDFMLPGQIVYGLLSAGLMAVGIGLANQRQSGALRHLFSTPVSVSLWTVSRMVANLVMSVLQLVILYGTCRILFKVAWPGNIAGTVIVLFTSAIASVSMGLIIGALSKNSDMAFPISIIVFVMMAFMGGTLVPLDGAPAIITTFSKLMPSYYMGDALKQVMMHGNSLTAVLPHIGILLAVSALLTGIAAWRMRKEFLAA